MTRPGKRPAQESAGWDLSFLRRGAAVTAAVAVVAASVVGVLVGTVGSALAVSRFLDV